MKFKLQLLIALQLIGYALNGQSNIKVENSFYNEFDVNKGYSPQYFRGSEEKGLCSYNHSIIVDRQSETSRQGCPLTFAEWSNFDGNALVQELKSTDEYECFRPIFNFENSTGYQLFSKQNFTLVCNELLTLIPTYDGQNYGNMYGLLIYLHAYLYHEFSRPEMKFNQVEFELYRDVVIAYSKNKNIWNISVPAYNNLIEFYTLCDYPGLRHLPEIYGSIKKGLSDMAVDKTWKQITSYPLQWYSRAYGALFYYLFRGIANYDQDYINLVNEDDEVMGLLAKFINDSEVTSEPDFNLYQRYAMVELLRFCSQQILIENAEPHIAEVAKTYPRYSSFWYRSVVAINMKGSCEKYNLCENLEDLNAEVRKILFPNQWVFDDGKIKIRTSLNYNTAQLLYYASKEVEAQFFRVNKTIKPLPDDINDSLRIVLYATRAEYEEWQYVLYGLNTNNGGIYIENNATFYTYERTRNESIYTLEELFRHEYVHYLSGRYMTPYDFSNSFFTQSERITWFNEGLAEHLSGSTPTGKVKVRQTNAQQLANDATSYKLTPQKIIDSKYSNGFDFYRYAHVFVKYLIEEEPVFFYEILNSIKNYDSYKFDSLMNIIRIEEKYNVGFNTYLDYINTHIDEWVYPVTKWDQKENLQLANIEDVKNYLQTNNLFSNAEVTQVSELSLPRFKINYKESSCKIDECIESLNNLPTNNFQYVVGYVTKDDGVESYTITGPLGIEVSSTNDKNALHAQVIQNPTNDLIGINTTECCFDLKVIDMHGKVVLQKITDRSAIFEISIGHLPAALYIIKLKKGEKQTSILVAKY